MTIERDGVACKARSTDSGMRTGDISAEPVETGRMSRGNNITSGQ